MSEEIPTILVKEKSTGRLRTINLSSFDSDLHEKAKASTKAEPTAFDREAAKEVLTAKGITFAKNVSNEKLAELLAEVSVTVPAFRVEQDGEKFVILNEKDEVVGQHLDTKEAAEQMLTIYTGSGNGQ
jgi:hypothetical protein